jgi:putative ubiquitin-RnfH superfamily antitoxin RatB of RatAB toxin-antitoxin module
MSNTAFAPSVANSSHVLCVELVYAQPTRIWSCQLSLPVGSTVAFALQASGFFRLFPDYPADSLRVGVFGRECTPEQELFNGDRLELYRPLVFDPMESRRRRAAHKKSAMNRPAARKRKKRQAQPLG